jgi:hypothetical protein
MSTNYDRFEIETPKVALQPRRRSGCFWGGIGLGCVGTVVLVCGGFFGMILWGISTVFKSSDVYQEAIEIAQNSPEVQQSLGDDIEATWPITGSLNMNADRGEVDMTIPLKGSNGSGKIRVKGTREGGDWNYEKIEFTDPQGKTIDLSAEPPPAVPEPVSDSAFESLGN